MTAATAIEMMTGMKIAVRRNAWPLVTVSSIAASSSGIRM